MDSPTSLGGTPYTMTKQQQQLRRRRSIKGRGDYSEEVKSIPKPLVRLEAKIDHLERSLVHTTPKITNAASTIGRTLGNFVNQGDLGALAGESLAKFFGHGDYKVKSNSLINGPISGPNPPKFGSHGKRGTRVMEREYIGDIVSGALVNGQSTFTNQSFRINPTDRSSFPWLSTIANQYDQWEPHGIVYEFVSTSSSYNGTSQALGTVVMATDYDVFDAVYPSKQIMENADYSCSTRPAESLVHGVECDPRERPTPILYCTTNAAANLQDLGNFQVATVGCSAAGTSLGELWVSYDITFYKKQLVTPATSLAAWCASGTCSPGGPLLFNPTVWYSRSITTTVVVGTGTYVNLPASQGSGRYLVTFYMSDKRTSDVMALTMTNCTSVSFTAAGSDGQPFIVQYIVNISSPGARLLVGMKTGSTNSDYKFNVTEVADTYTLP